MSHFLRRARWLVPIWALTVAALAVSVYAGLWLNALVLLVIGWLSVYAERLHQALVDTTAERDSLSKALVSEKRRGDAWRDQSIKNRVLLAARNPRADWEG